MSVPSWYLAPLDAAGLAWAQATVTAEHYLRKPVDQRCMPEAYAVHLAGVEGPLGCLIVGRPQSTRCAGWYGSIDDVAAGWAEVTRWQVLNLARVWLSPRVQPGGDLHRAAPGFTDRRGAWRSTLGTHLIGLLLHQIRAGYLVRRPPCFLEEPYELRWLLSYCDTRIHRGTLYRAAGAELYRTNEDGVQTWRWPLAPLTPAEDAGVRAAAQRHPRSRAFRARRSQLALTI